MQSTRLPASAAAFLPDSIIERKNARFVYVTCAESAYPLISAARLQAEYADTRSALDRALEILLELV